MTFDIGLHEACVRVGVRYVITKFSQMDSLPNFLPHGAPLCARFARARSSAIIGFSMKCNGTDGTDGTELEQVVHTSSSIVPKQLAERVVT